MAKPYEYTEKKSSRSNLLHTLNIWGADGWEYCDKTKTENDSYWVLLKRPIMDSALSGINQVTDKERLLEAFLQWFLNQQRLDERGYDVKDSVSDYLSL